MTSFALLRKEVENSCVAALWAGGLRGEPEAACLCPVCSRAMNSVSVNLGQKTALASVCLRCEFAWFDAGEFELLPAPPLRPRVLGEMDETQLPPAAREALALEKVRQLAEQEEPEPDANWITVAGVLGMPVEFNAPPMKREPWGTYALASLLIFVHSAIWRDVQGAAGIFGFIPADAWRYEGATFLTAFFLHAGVVHLVGNLYFLVTFGRHVED